jgi:hypothetical protein
LVASEYLGKESHLQHWGKAMFHTPALELGFFGSLRFQLMRVLIRLVFSLCHWGNSATDISLFDAAVSAYAILGTIASRLSTLSSQQLQPFSIRISLQLYCLVPYS